MILKWIFDRLVAFIGLLFLWPVLLITAILVKIKMPGGPAFFIQKRVGKDGKLFDCHKFRTMTVPDGSRFKVQGSRLAGETDNKKGGWSSVSVAGDSRITPLGAKLRHYKLDELPGLWDVLIGNMSFVGPRPDVPGYADQLQGDDRRVLKLRPGITGPATLKYRLEDEYLANARTLVAELINGSSQSSSKFLRPAEQASKLERSKNLLENLKKIDLEKMSDQEVAVWYNDNVIYPDKVRLNKYYLDHYSFIKDFQMILCTVLGKKMRYAGEVI